MCNASSTPPEKVNRSPFDRWLWERGVSDAAAAAPLCCSAESVRRWRLPLAHPDFRAPRRENLERIVAYTGGAITGEAFLPSHLTADAAIGGGAAARP